MNRPEQGEVLMVVSAGDELDYTKYISLCCSEIATAGVDRRSLERHAENEAHGQVGAAGIRGQDNK